MSQMQTSWHGRRSKLIVAQNQVSEIKLLDGSENKTNAGVFRELWKEVKAEKARARAQSQNRARLEPACPPQRSGL